MTTQNRVAVLDAGGQYVDLVKKALERQGVAADVLPLATKLGELESTYSAIVISGSPASSRVEAAPMPDEGLWQTKLPLLGICYGMQAMAVALGGEVAKNATREDGRITTTIDPAHPLFNGLKPEFSALFTHGDFVAKVPTGFQIIGSHRLSSGNEAYSAIARDNLVGVQFHPEVFDDTPGGYQVFANFLKWAKVKPNPDFTSRLFEQLIERKIKEIKKQVGDKSVIGFVSGGVDSSVAISLCAKAVAPDKLHGFYIDNGFMRFEDEQVIENLHSAGIKVVKIEAASDFEQTKVEIDGVSYGPLVSATDPEIKRKIIGKAFIDVQTRIIEDLGLDDAILLQGTNAADRIESGYSHGDSHTMTIKTHHNQVKEVQALKASGNLLEPLDDLFKDEVRRLGSALGLPDQLVLRQPFPGPGLAIRILTSDSSTTNLPPDRLNEQLNKHIYTSDIAATARLLPIRSVGVGGDERSHLGVVALYGPGLSAGQLRQLGSDLPAYFLGKLNRVIYSLTDNLLTGLHETKTDLSSATRDQLRQADRIVFEEMREHKLLDKISQFPVILLPLSFSSPGERAIVLRPVKTSTFMTVQAMLPGEHLPEDFLTRTAERIKTEVSGISAVFLDITNKPPATTEWE